jgi:hypothetical protein
LLLQLKKIVHLGSVCIKNSSVGALSAEKKKNKETFDLNRLKKKDEFFPENEKNNNQQSVLLDILKKELSLTSI